MGYSRHITPWIYVNIGSGKGLLLGGTDPLPEPIESVNTTSMENVSTGVLDKK